MATVKLNSHACISYLFLLVCALFHFHVGQCQLQLNYYAHTCPNAEEIVKNTLVTIRAKTGTVAESFLRYLFHDCIVKSCDASLLLISKRGVKSEHDAERNFGLRNFKYLEAIKEAVERECPSVVSCADVLALSARDSIEVLGGPQIPIKTGRRDSLQSYYDDVDKYVPLHNESTSSVISRFESIGLEVEETVAILGAHSVGRTHCKNLVDRLYPTVDPTMDPEFANYLKTKRCTTAIPDAKNLHYARNDLATPYILDNYYYKNVIAHKGRLTVDQELLSDPITAPFVQKFAADNDHFFEVFSRGILKLSENNPLTGNQGEIRKNCQFVNSI